MSAHLRDVADGVAGRDDLIRESIRISARQDARAQESKTIDRHKELRDELARALPYTESAPVADFGVVDIYRLGRASFVQCPNQPPNVHVPRTQRTSDSPLPAEPFSGAVAVPAVDGVRGRP